MTSPESGLGVASSLPWLGGGGDTEVWHTSVRPRVERQAELRLAVAGPALFGAIELPAAGAEELEESTRRAYHSLSRGAREAGCPHPLRFWNVVPAINEVQQGLERYRRFCRARAEAFEEHFGSAFAAQLCASSAVGSASGPLQVCLLAGREPGRHRENPRQVSAFRYPAEYGPKSPSFARATHCPPSLGRALLVSGTASIVGHRTVHADCARCQLDETLRNMEALVQAHGRQEAPFRALRVYLRHPQDLETVRQRLEERLGRELPVLYLHADICRRDLCLEIEAIA